ncbi:hypothetical protein CEXT_361371 [Caerostris extrusa]|uniref:Uncharacterized protein n=1 Tax=Caerostris extrusa TaxID=172846 RepID=A0AAV4WCF3_CAEEX|nr:hypothetical protein CEXT_361371 [Caerostris extrusa]
MSVRCVESYGSCEPSLWNMDYAKGEAVDSNESGPSEFSQVSRQCCSRPFTESHAVKGVTRFSCTGCDAVVRAIDLRETNSGSHWFPFHGRVWGALIKEALQGKQTP